MTAVIIMLLFCVGMLALLAFLPVLLNEEDNAGEAIYVIAEADNGASGNLKIFPCHDDVSGKIYFFLPGAKDASKYYLYLNGTRSVQIGGETYASGSELPSDMIMDIGSEGNRDGINIEYENKEKESFSEEAYFLCGGEVDTISLSLGEDAIDKVDEDPIHSVSAVADYAVYDTCNHKEAAGKLKIAGHGNSTWTELMEEFPGQEFKRSYNISFNEQKKSILGMKPAGSFVLLSNFYDESEIKNYIAMEAARELGMEEVPDCEYANLYINGHYRGLYLVAQKIKEGNGFLDISSDGYLAKFDYEERVKANGNLWFETEGLFAKLMYPTDIDGERLDAIREDVRKTEGSIGKGYDKFCENADADSFAAYYMMQEFFENGDADRASQYIYKRKGTDKLVAGPVWDFDLSMGHPWFSYEGEETSALWLSGIVDESGWLRKLSDDDKFMEKTCDYYKESFSKVVDEVTRDILPETAGRIENSWYMDMLRYENGPVYFDKFDYEGRGFDKYDQNAIVGEISKWLTDRKDFWDGYAANPGKYEAEISEPGADTRSIRRLVVMKKR